MFINIVIDDNLMTSRSYQPGFLKRRLNFSKPLWSVNGLFTVTYYNN